MQNNPDEMILMIGVIGVSEDGCFARLYVNAKSGEIIIAEKKRNPGGKNYKDMINIATINLEI